MKVIKPSFEILTEISEGGIEELKKIEAAARTCYRSEDKITDDGESAKKIVRSLVKSGHLAMIEHSQLTVRFIVDRGVSHEIVRHRLCSFAQESTRYCGYDKTKFNGQVTFISPVGGMEIEGKQGVDGIATVYAQWVGAMMSAESSYLEMLRDGVSPQIARSVLPNSVATQIVVTANYREWREIFRLRCDAAAHPQMREVMIPLRDELRKRIPIVFDEEP